MAIRVLHLVGSPTSDFYADLSRLYAADCLSATADPSRYDAVIAYVSPDGCWRFPDGLDPVDLAAAPRMSVAGAMTRIAGMDIAVMVPQMFCPAGMTHYRSLFDVLGIPYAGNAGGTMALGTDKAMSKAIVSAAGVLTPPGQLIVSRDQQLPEATFPVVVKPVDADNSFGVTLVHTQPDLAAAVADAFDHGNRVLIEAYIRLGREVRCGVLERDGELLVLPLEEYAVDEATHPVRGYADKVRAADDGELGLVAKEQTKAWIVAADDPINEPVGNAAKDCHRALGCRDYSLFDFRVDPDGRPWFLEAGLYCSFAEQSVIAMMARATGLGVDVLFATAVEQALTRSASDASHAMT